MLTDKTLGQVAYEAYRRCLDQRFRDEPLPPPWPQQRARIRDAWIVAAQAVRATLTREGPQP